MKTLKPASAILYEGKQAPRRHLAGTSQRLAHLVHPSLGGPVHPESILGRALELQGLAVSHDDEMKTTPRLPRPMPAA